MALTKYYGVIFAWVGCLWKIWLGLTGFQYILDLLLYSRQKLPIFRAIGQK